MLAPCVWIGVYPQPLLKRAEPELTQLVDQVRADYRAAMGDPVRQAAEKANRRMSGMPYATTARSDAAST